MGILRSKVTPVYMKQMAGAPCSLTFAPIPTTPGATQVNNGAQLEAAVGAAVPGETIELASAGAYTLTAGALTITAANLTISAVVTGAYINGANRIQSGAAGSTFKGIDFRNGDGVYTTYFTAGSSPTFERCRFAGNTQIALHNAGTGTVDSCLFVGTYSHSGLRNHTGGTTVARNCIANFAGAGIGFYNNGGVSLTCYNCAANVTANDYFGCAGDYNADTDGTAPGGNSVHNVTWGNEYNANYEPILATSTLYTAGTFAQVPAADYNGNTFPNPPCIGIINCPV